MHGDTLETRETQRKVYIYRYACASFHSGTPTLGVAMPVRLCVLRFHACQRWGRGEANVLTTSHKDTHPDRFSI